MRSFFLLVLVALTIGAAFGATATLPSVTVSGVTATSPVLRSTAGIAVSATVTSTFDTGSGPTTTTTNSSCKLNPDNYCGTGNSSVTDQTVDTTKTVTVSNTSTSANATDAMSTGALTLSSGSVYSGNLLTPLRGTDGKITVTVTASVSEDVTTTVTTVTTNKHCVKSGNVTTCTVVSAATNTSSSTVTNTRSCSDSNSCGSASYELDINPPILTLGPADEPQPFVQQGGTRNAHNKLFEGSVGTAYSITDTATLDADSSTSYSASGTGSFPSNNDKATDLVGVHIPCTAPVGPYTVTATALTNDLGGFAFPVISSQSYAGPPAGSASDSFTVVPGVALQNLTYVVSDLPQGYDTMKCFTAAQSGKKISTYPGSYHIAAVINTTGPCSGFATITGPKVTLTLPTGFYFDATGASPAAHVFMIAGASGGFDYHYPGPEIALPKYAITGANTNNLVVNLGGVDVGQGAGVFPSSATIYVRAHVAYNGSTVPADGTSYIFTTSTEATLTGVGLTTATKDWTVTKNSACVNGN